MGRAAEDLTGKTFGRLTAKHRVERPDYYSDTAAWWLCECKCGETVIVPAKHLKDKNTKSCGCLRAEMGAATLRRYNASRRKKHDGGKTE